MTRSFAVLGLVLAVLCAGCGRESITITPGIYKGSYGGATEVFAFNSNGVFSQILSLNGEAKYTNEGSWKIEKKPSKLEIGQTIVLSPFVCALDTRTGSLRSPPMKYGHYFADRDEEKQQIEFDMETGYYLKKTDGEE